MEEELFSLIDVVKTAEPETVDKAVQFMKSASDLILDFQNVDSNGDLFSISDLRLRHPNVPQEQFDSYTANRSLLKGLNTNLVLTMFNCLSTIVEVANKK